MNKAWNLIAIFSPLMLLLSCQEKEKRLPILGPKEVQASSGTGVPDTVYYTIPDFTFTNQDSQQVTPETFKGKIYVADFFFTSCPSICPIMKSQMLRVFEKYIEKYIIHQKIEKVKELLSYDEMNLSEIASELGYSSVHHLSSQFKSVTGISVNAYKEARNKEGDSPDAV